MRRNKVWNKSCMSPLIESLFFNRCFQVAGFDYLFTITIPVFNISASPFLYQSLVLMGASQSLQVEAIIGGSGLR